ncbi:MAG: GNAT family N-acetyltransferase [Planctomycetes bacterium]|nr:GNAT family N-acetyltransferase [Planctomycetota bacterium]
MELHEVVELSTRDRKQIIRLMRRTGVFNEDEIEFLGRMFDHCRLGWGPCELSVYGVRGNGQELKGFIAYGPTPLTEGTMDIYWLAVDPREQQRGIGSALVEHVCKEAQKAGTMQVVIETSSSEKYEPTREAYGRMRFAETARIPDYYRPGDDRIILVRRL